MIQKLDSLLDRLSDMTDVEQKELEASYLQYREEEVKGLRDAPFEFDIPEKLKN